VEALAIEAARDGAREAPLDALGDCERSNEPNRVCVRSIHASAPSVCGGGAVLAALGVREVERDFAGRLCADAQVTPASAATAAVVAI
jgi:hypothetical protein